jgi:hypothetical protein
VETERVQTEWERSFEQKAAKFTKVMTIFVCRLAIFVNFVAFCSIRLCFLCYLCLRTPFFVSWRLCVRSVKSLAVPAPSANDK